MAADAAQAAALLCTAGPWVLMPGPRHAFTVADSPPGPGRLICLVGVPPEGRVGSVLEVTHHASEYLIRARTRSGNPVGKLVVALSAVPHRRGVRVGLDLRAASTRNSKTFLEGAWRKSVTAWLAAIAEALEGRRPWPAEEMPADVQRAWCDRPPADHDVEEVEGVVKATPAAAWQAVRSPATQRGPMAPVSAGYVPGTPQQQVGEMIYQVLPLPDDRLVATIFLVTDMDEGRWVRTRRVGSQRIDGLTSLQPAGDGTKITLTARVPHDAPAKLQAQVETALRARMAAYQDLLGRPG